MQKEWRLTKHQRLFCSVLHHRTTGERRKSAQNLLEALGSEAALALAQANEITPIIAHALIDSFSPEKISKHWSDIHEKSLLRISAYLRELDGIASHLAQQGIPLVVLKNGGIARGVYPCPGCCPMGDLDVLIERRHFRHAHQILLKNGYHFEFRNPLEATELEAAEGDGSAEYWKVLPGNIKLWLELQWRPIAGRWIRPDQEPSGEELIARSFTIPDTAVRLLSPEDNLLQVALHTAKHSYVRAPGFRLHVDVERIVRSYPGLDWDLFANRVKALQVKTAVYFSLVISYDLFGTPVPAQVLAALRPPAWKERLIIRWLNRVGLFNPHEHKFSKPGYILFNALLYDDLAGLLRGIFPNQSWMRSRYHIKDDRLLPYYHARRLLDLTFRRVNT